jgi:hypothetical protein
VRAHLVANGPIARWGLGYVQGGDTLLVRTPKASAGPLDLAAPLATLHTDCAIGLAIAASDRDRYGGPDNTPPFRFRRWLYAQTGLSEVHDIGDVVPHLLAHIPEYLRRNLKGRTTAELVFHVFLAMLHDEGSGGGGAPRPAGSAAGWRGGGIDDANLPVAAMRRALSSTMRLLATERAKANAPGTAGNLAVTNGRAMVLARIGETMRLRRLTVDNDRGERDDGFRGVLVVSGAGAGADDREARDGFEDVPMDHAVMITRELQVQLAALH